MICERYRYAAKTITIKKHIGTIMTSNNMPYVTMTGASIISRFVVPWTMKGKTVHELIKPSMINRAERCWSS